MSGSVRWQTAVVIDSTQMLCSLHKKEEILVIKVANEVKVVAKVITRQNVSKTIFHATPPHVKVFALNLFYKYIY